MSWWRTGFKNDEWYVEFDQAKRIPGTFKEECLRVASELPDDSVIFLSGGKDSEVIAHCFIELNKKFKCVILRYLSNRGFVYNEYDIVNALTFCFDNGLDFFFKDIEIDNYYKDDELYEKYRKYDRTGEYANWIWMIEDIEGYHVGGNGIIIDHCFRGSNIFESKSNNNDAKFGDYVYPSRMVGDADYWWFGVSEQIGDSWENWYNGNGTSKFFSYDAEIFLSQLLDPLMNDMFNNKFDIQIGGDLKNEFYSQYFDIVHRPKYTGIENVIRYSNERKEFLERHKDSILQDEDIVQHRWKIEDLIRMIYPN